jgi:spore coat protein U-like protein
MTKFNRGLAKIACGVYSYKIKIIINHFGKYKTVVRGVTFAGFSLLSQIVPAAPSICTISVHSVNFGAYSVFSTSPNNNSGGSINIDCNKNSGGHVNVTLSTGESHSYTSREMRSGDNHLNYNLYTSAARTEVWGDGKGCSSVMSADKENNTTLSIFGQIPAGQDASVGTYNDNITVIVEF